MARASVLRILAPCVYAARHRLASSLLLLVVSIALIIIVIVIHSNKLAKEMEMERRLIAMQAHLEFLESLYRARQEDVINLQSKLIASDHRNNAGRSDVTLTPMLPEVAALLQNLTGTKAASGVTPKTLDLFQTTFVYQLLPHLMENPHSLRPAYHMRGGRSFVDVVMGIPTVKRDKESYLLVTLKHLLDGMARTEKNSTLIVVYVGDTDLEYVVETARQIETMFPNEVATGLIEVISPAPSYYPDFDRLPTTLGDSVKRFKWRTKQNLDSLYLMAYGQTKGTYYLMLEDDIVAKKRFLETIKEFTSATTVSNPHWFFIDFAQIGGIGKLFRSKDLVQFCVYVQLFYANLPIDWLLESYVADRVCTDDKFTADTEFGAVPTFYPHVNPPAERIWTDIEEHSNHLLVKAYNGQTFFWGITPRRGNVAEIWFEKPENVERFTFRSGNVDHVSDRFYNTIVEVLPVGAGNFTKVVAFDEFGLARGELSAEVGPITAIRLRVLGDSTYWAILSEIEIELFSSAKRARSQKT